MISKILSALGKVPWWGWVAAGICLLLIINAASGSVYSRKLWNMVKDQIITEEKKIIDDLKKENSKLLQDKYTLQKQIFKIQEQRKELQRENMQLEDQLNAIRKRLEAVTIPDDPDALVIELRKYLGSASRRR